MFIVWQSGQDVVRAGDLGEQTCGNCSRTCPHSVMVRYNYTNFYWALGVMTGFAYFFACDRCNAAIQVDKREAKPLISNVPIPFMRRFGCLAGIAVGVLFVLFLSIAKK